ncbi:MAG TPA: helicase-related protein [Vicinamibacterales bacterium]|nr:helicase-related protein [Vicinamibacterales bacterium]
MHGVLPAPGSFIWIRRRRWRVQHVTRDRATVRVDVGATDERRTFLAPFDRLQPEEARRRPARARRSRARAVILQLFARSHSARWVSSAVGARIDVLPYQLEPALAVHGGARRVLLADQVGLGKTIQAGLVLAEVVGRHPAARVLIVVPSGLAGQWALELSTRFGIASREVTRTRLDADVRASSRHDDPWRRSGVVLASLDFLKQPHVLDAIPPVPWQLVIVDEAHGVCGDSARHHAVTRLARVAERVLLLTATPHSGDQARFERLLNLGGLDDPSDPLIVFRRTRAELGADRPRRVCWRRLELPAPAARLLDALGDFERALLAASTADSREPALLLLSVFRKRALSTSHAALATFSRRLAWLEAAAERSTAADAVQLALAFSPEGDDDGEPAVALAVTTGMPVRQERAWLGRLVSLARSAARSEHKVERLATLLSRSPEPAIVFSEFRASLEVVARRLETVRTVAVLHGGLSDAERREALDAFRSGRATVLVATDVAGQGLNLQDAARWVVSLELPWNPARLEQRFGRVDRIGQSRRAHLTLLVARHPTEDGLLLHLARRTLLAQQAIGAGPFAELLATLPAEADVRATLFGERAPAAWSGARLPVCRRWQRVARRHAATLLRARALAGRWPARVVPTRPVWSRGGPRTRDSAPAAILVFDVAVVGASGAVIERRPAALRVPGLVAASDLTPALLERAAETVRDGLKSRLGRLERVKRSEAERLERRMTLVLRRLERDLEAARPQPGLFDRRAEARLAGMERRLALARIEIDRSIRVARACEVTAHPRVCAVLLPS